MARYIKIIVLNNKTNGGVSGASVKISNIIWSKSGTSSMEMSSTFTGTTDSSGVAKIRTDAAVTNVYPIEADVTITGSLITEKTEHCVFSYVTSGSDNESANYIQVVVKEINYGTKSFTITLKASGTDGLTFNNTTFKIYWSPITTSTSAADYDSKKFTLLGEISGVGSLTTTIDNNVTGHFYAFGQYKSGGTALVPRYSYCGGNASLLNSSVTSITIRVAKGYTFNYEILCVDDDTNNKLANVGFSATSFDNSAVLFGDSVTNSNGYLNATNTTPYKSVTAHLANYFDATIYMDEPIPVNYLVFRLKRETYRIRGFVYDAATCSPVKGMGILGIQDNMYSEVGTTDENGYYDSQINKMTVKQTSIKPNTSNYVVNLNKTLLINEQKDARIDILINSKSNDYVGNGSKEWCPYIIYLQAKLGQEFIKTADGNPWRIPTKQDVAKAGGPHFTTNLTQTPTRFEVLTMDLKYLKLSMTGIKSLINVNDYIYVSNLQQSAVDSNNICLGRVFSLNDNIAYLTVPDNPFVNVPQIAQAQTIYFYNGNASWSVDNVNSKVIKQFGQSSYKGTSTSPVDYIFTQIFTLSHYEVPNVVPIDKAQKLRLTGTPITEGWDAYTNQWMYFTNGEAQDSITSNPKKFVCLGKVIAAEDTYIDIDVSESDFTLENKIPNDGSITMFTINADSNELMNNPKDWASYEHAVGVDSAIYSGDMDSAVYWIKDCVNRAKTNGFNEIDLDQYMTF